MRLFSFPSVRPCLCCLATLPSRCDPGTADSSLKKRAYGFARSSGSPFLYSSNVYGEPRAGITTAVDHFFTRFILL